MLAHTQPSHPAPPIPAPHSPPHAVNRCTPLYTRILSLYAENNDLEIAVPGGLIGIGTQIDPTLTRADRLVGQVLGHRGRLPHVYIRISVKYHLLRRLLGSRAQEGDKSAKVSRLKQGEVIMANIGSTSTSATVRWLHACVCVRGGGGGGGGGGGAGICGVTGWRLEPRRHSQCVHNLPKGPSW